MINEQNIQKLRDLMVSEFGEDELQTICRDIGLSYADLPGMGPYGKTREMINAVQQLHLVRTLMNRVEQLRPSAYKEAGLETVEPEKSTVTPQAGMPAPTPPAAGSGMFVPQAPITVAAENMPSAAKSSPAMTPATGDRIRPDSPIHDREVSSTMDTGGSRKSALPLRVRLIGFIIVVLLLAVAALSIVLQPRKGGTPVSPPPTTAVTLLPASGAITDTSQISPLLGVKAATPLPVAPVPTPAPTGTVSETHPAALAIRSINDTLVAFYGGTAKAEDLKPDFTAAKYQVILNFAYKTLKTKLGADLQKGDVLNVTLRYGKVPTMTSDKNGIATVVTKEYWAYTFATTSKSYCDNSEYTYTLSKVGDNYQVRDLKSRAISSKCEQ
ncbi:MAG TPA: hypothetical protein VGK87_00840 [Anaerolineae bacterium]|jgi:hypothetical protein